MENLSEQFETEQPTIPKIEASDWAEKALNNAQALEIFPYEKSLASKLIEEAFKFSQKETLPLGITLAASFDLLITAQYYRSVANTKWYYCPHDQPILFYPFTNTCPRCILTGSFHFEEANKPASGTIGQATSRLLSVFLKELLARAGKNLQIYRGSEPVDMLIYDEEENTILLAEIKAAPLTTLALATVSDKLTESVDGEEPIPISPHSQVVNTSLSSSELYMFLPMRKNGDNSYHLVSLGNVNTTDHTWGYKNIEQVLDQNQDFFEDYLHFWIEAFEAYKANYRAARRGGQFAASNTFWLTNACGQPFPRPMHWPSRKKGTGFESVSDSKTSVGMDRTDDIKKGIYQVLKVGAESKLTTSRYKVKTALISNIHAVRHYDEYLHLLEDVVWLSDRSKEAKKVSDLPQNADVYNLFDGIISFTKSHIRDEWIQKNFVFSAQES